MLENEYGKIKTAFNKAAGTYDKACDMQLFAAQKLISELDHHLFYDTIMDIGCGTGHITKQLINTVQFGNYHALDIADSSLEQAKKRITHPNVNFILANFDQFTTKKSCSLIFSNMALHWSCDLSKLLNNIYNTLTPNGILAFTIPLTGTLHELKESSVREFHASHTVISLLKHHEFTIEETTQHTYKKQFNSHYDALLSLKQTGVTHIKKRTQTGLIGKNILTKLFKNPAAIPCLTYEIGVFIARKT